MEDMLEGTALSHHVIDVTKQGYLRTDPWQDRPIEETESYPFGIKNRDPEDIPAMTLKMSGMELKATTQYYCWDEEEDDMQG
jgi:hypothetical protein